MQSSSDPLLRISNLSKSYGSVRAVTDLSLEVGRGQVFGILGPNGSGKTTTLSILTGILEQDEGSFRWFGEKPSAAVRRKIGSLIETPSFYPYMSLENNLKLIAQVKECGVKDIPEVLKTVKLFERRKSKFSTLSLGMKQRLSIASTLMGNPEVLVLDEPTNGLDPEGIAEVRELIFAQAESGKTIIMASHILSEVEKICTEVAILKSGQLLALGNVKALLKGESMLKVRAGEPEKLKGILESCPFVDHFQSEDGGFIVGLKEGSSPADLNRFVFEKGLALGEIIVYQKSLESQFLELVKE
jgi:ABC-type multidrug transport system ATPase subunit